MSDNTLAENFKECVNACIDRLYRFFADDGCEYEGVMPDNGKLDIEIHLTIKARKK
ncbi:MAG: hypothetical protein ACK5MU_04205 [Candidatus Saccharimonadales bacterium]